jgi:hypothetical protein
MARRRPKEHVPPRAETTRTLTPARDSLLFVVLAFALFFKILLGSAWLWEDMLMFSYPMRVFASTSLAMGQFPLWNPYTFSGMPFFADIQTAVLYLPSLALALFVKGNALNFYWLEVMVILHYVLAGWGMYRLALSYDLDRAASLFAGSAYMLSGFMITHAIHQQVITLVAWYPLIFLSFRKMMREKGWRWMCISAVLVGHSILAGFPQLSLYLFFFLGVYTLWQLFTPTDDRRLLSTDTALIGAKALVMVALALALASVQLLPSIELAPLSQRAQITYEKATEGSLSYPQLFTLILPKLFGTAGAQSYAYWGPGPYWYFWETCIYLGILPLFLAAIALVLRPGEKELWFYSGVGLFSLFFALGGSFPLHRFFFDYVPGFSTFRDPARMGIFLSFAASLLSAFALDRMARPDLGLPARFRARSIVAGVGVFSLAMSIAILSGALDGSFPFLHNPAEAKAVHASTTSALVIIAASLGLILILLSGDRPRPWARYLAIPLLAVDMLMFAAGQNDSARDPAQYFGRAAPIVRFIHAEESREGPLRVNTRNPNGMLMDRNQGMVDRIQMMEGYTPLVLQRAYPPFRTDDQRFDLLNVRYKVVTDTARGSLRFVANPTAMPRAYFMYDVRVLPSDEAVLAAVADTSWHYRTTAFLDRDPGIPISIPAAPSSSSARVTMYEDNLIGLKAETGDNGLLVLGEIWYPGWEAEVDGRPAEVLRVDGGLRGVAVEAGSHEIVIRFVSPPFRRGMAISLVALVLCLAGIVVPRRYSTRGES